MENRYQFEKSPKKKGTCPACNHKNEFRFMYDTITGIRLPEIFGRCERQNNCGYTLHPTKENYSQHFLNTHKINKSYMNNTPISNNTIVQTNQIKFIDESIVLKTKLAYTANNFVIWLQSLFEVETVNNILNSYHLGTSKDNSGTIFWYCDFANNFRTGKIICYQNNGHRNKNITPYYIHNKLSKNQNENYELCFFGEHLLNLPINQNKTIAIVESEKSAIVASLYIPEFVFLACGGANGLTENKMNVLKNRKTILISDLDKAGRESFEKRANEYKSKGYKIALFDIAPEINNSMDIADFLINEKPIIKQVTNEIETQIINHYQSYKMPYDYTNCNDLQSLVRGYNFEFQTNISNELYLNTLLKFEIPTVKFNTNNNEFITPSCSDEIPF